MTAEAALRSSDTAEGATTSSDSHLRPSRFKPAKRDLDAPIVRFATEVLGFELWPRQVEILAAAYRARARTLVLRLGRRSGKGRMAAAIAVFEAVVNASAHLAAVPKGERPTVAIIANAQDQARIAFGYVRHFLEAPALRHLVSGEPGRYELNLATGIDVVVLPASGRSARGRAIAVAIWDEAAHSVDGDGRLLSPQAATEIWEAVSPATLQFPEGKVVVISTPRYAAGLFHRLCVMAESGEHSTLWTYHAATAEMNPLIPAAELERARAQDPDLFRREWLAEFDAGVGALYDAELVEAAVIRRSPLEPVAGVRYVVAVDPAYSGDAWAAIVGHLINAETVVVDRSTAWQGRKGKPLDHRAVLDDVAALARAYRQAPVHTDQYAAAAIVSGLRERGISIEAFAWTNESKLEAASALRRRLYAGTIELPDDRVLIGELTALEQRLTPGGRPRIAAPGNAHDDRAMALLALVAAFERRPRVATSTSYKSESDIPVIRRGGLTLIGRRYVDRP